MISGHSCPSGCQGQSGGVRSGDGKRIRPLVLNISDLNELYHIQLSIIHAKWGDGRDEKQNANSDNKK